MDYNEFLHTKIEVAPVSGFEVRAEDIHPALKPHQRDAVMWAIRGGRGGRCLSLSAWARRCRSWNGADWCRNMSRLRSLL